MMDHRKLHEMIDACRPGSEDIQLPEMLPLADRIAVDADLRDRYQRSQRLDARIARSMDDVAVPVGLRERILARLAAEEGACERMGTGSEPIAGEPANQASREVPVPILSHPQAIEGPGVRGQASRRRWIISVAAVAAALLVLITGYKFWPRRAPLTYDGLLNLSSQWYERLQASPAWQPLAVGEMIRDFPPADAIRPRPQHWADVTAMIGQPARAYDLSSLDGHRATLFVIANEDRVAGSRPSPRPGSSTGGLMIGCWQSGELVYVLVVEGDEATYRSMLDGASHPLANWKAIRPMLLPIRKLSLDCPVG